MEKFTQDDINKLGNTIIYLAQHISDLSKTKLLKLLYLLEECSVIKYKTPFLELDFEVWQAGPVAKEIYIDLSNDEQILLKDYIAMEGKCSIPGTYVRPLRDFDDSEFSDNNLSLMDFVIQKYGNMTASELVSIVHAKNTLWYKIAKENNLLKDFTGHKKTYSDFKIDLSQYLTGCDSEFYNEQKDLNDIARTLKL